MYSRYSLCRQWPRCSQSLIKVKSATSLKQPIGWNHKLTAATFHEASRDTIRNVSEDNKGHRRCAQSQAYLGGHAFRRSLRNIPEGCGAAGLQIQAPWPFTGRYKLMAATIIGQGKNVWQAEIDAAAELIDFWKFNCSFAEAIYAMQPSFNAAAVWNRVEYRPLDGFVTAISPFNFTAIGGNLPSAPALMGNVVLWKPSPSAMRSNYLVYNILREAGLPNGVIQFVPAAPAEFVEETMSHPDFAGLHFTGSTQVLQELWKKAAENLDLYKSYPRIVGETGGKNMHFIHASADLKNAVCQTARAAFEYQGQKCSACSRLYVPDVIWDSFRDSLLQELAKMKMGPPTGSQSLSRFPKPLQCSRQPAGI
jgi:delta 1-pyrroline-5-carboxylate dehydrogenase